MQSYKLLRTTGLASSFLVTKRVPADRDRNSFFETINDNSTNRKTYDYQTKQAKKRIKTLYFHRSNLLGFPLSKIIFPGPRRFPG